MYKLPENPKNMLCCKEKPVIIFVLLVFLSVCACDNSKNEKELKPIEKITIGIKNKKMRELWVKAHKQGNLPPIEEIPVPDSRIAQRRPLTTEEIQVARPARPLINEKIVAEVQPFSQKSITQYKGNFQVIEDKPGVLIGKLDNSDNLLEFHYKLPMESKKLSISKDSKLLLSFRDRVQDSALQRRIVLSNQGSIVPFVHISEGSTKPYKEVIKEIGLIVEQKQAWDNPPVKVTYMDKTITLKQGERRKIGEGEKAVEVYLNSSIALDQKKQILLEGQPFYVNLVIYKK